MTHAPGAIAVVWVSDQTPGPAAPSSNVKRTPCFTPAGVGAVPWFLIVALSVTALPGAGSAGSQEISVTTRSGLPEESGTVGVGVGVGDPVDVTLTFWRVTWPAGTVFAIVTPVEPTGKVFETISISFTVTLWVL